MSLIKFEDKLKELVELSIEARCRSTARAINAFHLSPEEPAGRKAEEARQAALQRDALVDKLTAYVNGLKRIKF